MLKIYNYLRKYWFALLIPVMILLFLFSATRKENLSAYVDTTNKTYTSSVEKNDPEDIYTVFTHETINFSIPIPKEWVHAKDDTTDIFTHTGSGSSISIDVNNYNPRKTLYSEESLNQYCTQKGMTLKTCKDLGNNGYCLTYQNNTSSGTINYVEYDLWDFEHSVTVVATFNNEYYDKLWDKISYCLDNISWDYENKIPDGFYVHYDDTGDYQFLIPSNWITGESNNSIFAYNEENSLYKMEMTLVDDTSLISEFSELEYVNFLQGQHTNFVVDELNKTENYFYAEAQYNDDGTQMVILQKYIANGMYHYILTYEFPYADNSTDISSFKEAMTHFEVFMDTVVSDNEDETIESSTTDSTDGLLEPEINETSKITESSNITDNMETNNNTKNDTPNEVSSLEEAFTQVAGISNEAASVIVSICNSSNVGSIVNLKAIKESDSDIILQGVTSDNINLFFYIEKDTGILKKIHINDETGPILYQDNSLY